MYIIPDSMTRKDWVFKQVHKRLLHKVLNLIGLGRKTIGAVGINPSGDWTNYLPTIEYQKFRNYDDYGCVSHSMQNALETLAYFKIYHGDKALETVLKKFDCIDEFNRPNFDDWFTVIKSGTIPWRGNSQRNVWECGRKDGLIGQQFDFNDLTTQKMYNKPVPDVLTAKGKEILEYLDINWEWVDRLWKFGGRFNYSNDAVLKEAMTHSPLQVVVLNNTHCEMAYKVQGHNTFNSYKGTEHKIYNDCTEWAYPVKCNISVKKKKAEELMKFTTYKIHGNPTICVKVRGEDALLAFAGGVLEGGTLFKSLYDCEYSDMPREYVDKWQYPIKYEITTIKS